MEAAAEAAGWLARRSSAAWWANGRLLAPVDRWIEILLPLVDAYEAGLWLFYAREKVIAVPRPVLRSDGDRLHSTEGPAVYWPGGPRWWFLHGVEVPRRAVEAPESLSAREIAAEPNVEVRRVLIERFGYERYLREWGADQAAVDDLGTLWRLELPDDEPLVVVEVLDSTPQPDGSCRRYFLRVPPTAPTPRAAVAWTFGLERPEDYEPATQT